MIEILDSPKTSADSPERKQKPSHLSKRCTVGRSQLSLMLDAQAKLIQRLETSEPSDKDLAGIACAIERLGNRITRLRGIPEPKPVDTTAKPKSSRAQSAEIDP